MAVCSVEDCEAKIIRQCRCLLSDMTCEAGHHTHRCPKCKQRVQHAAEDRTHAAGYDARCDKCRAIPQQVMQQEQATITISVDAYAQLLQELNQYRLRAGLPLYALSSFEPSEMQSGALPAMAVEIVPKEMRDG